MTFLDTSWAKGFLADLNGSSAESYNSIDRLQKVQANAGPNASSRE
jgi:hypothetical protein